MFDYDGAVFETLSEEPGSHHFLAHGRYYLSDHRSLWAEFPI